MKPTDTIDLVFDTELRRPACVLLQAVYGCGGSNGFLHSTFNPRDWLVSPTPAMRKIRGTREQWRQMAAQLRCYLNGELKVKP